MNWTGGSFARHSRYGGGLARRQKQHFARARTKLQSSSHRSLSPLKLSFAGHGRPSAESTSSSLVLCDAAQRPPERYGSRSRWLGKAESGGLPRRGCSQTDENAARGGDEPDLFGEHGGPVEPETEMGGRYDDHSPESMQKRPIPDRRARGCTRGNLEEQTAKLLTRRDWVGTDITRPLKIRFPLATERANIGKRRRLDGRDARQVGSAIRQHHESDRLGHPAVNSRLMDFEARAREETIIRIGDARLGANRPRRIFGPQPEVREVDTRDRLQGASSDSSLSDLVEAEPQGFIPRAFVSRYSSGGQGHNGEHSDIGPIFRDHHHGLGKQKSGNLRRKEERSVPGREIELAGLRYACCHRCHHRTSEISLNDNESALEKNERSHLERSRGRHPRGIDSVIELQDQEAMTDVTSDSLTSMGTEALHTHVILQDAPDVFSSIPMEGVDREVDEMLESGSAVPRSTEANAGTQTEHPSAVCTLDDSKWKRWLSAAASSNDCDGLGKTQERAVAPSREETGGELTFARDKTRQADESWMKFVFSDSEGFDAG